jgi:hypothetical protein
MDHTTVTEQDYNDVLLLHREAFMNEGNPFKHRLGVISLQGMTITDDIV